MIIVLFIEHMVWVEWIPILSIDGNNTQNTKKWLDSTVIVIIILSWNWLEYKKIIFYGNGLMFHKMYSNFYFQIISHN